MGEKKITLCAGPRGNFTAAELAAKDKETLDKLYGRLINWKFESAKRYLDELLPHEPKLVPIVKELYRLSEEYANIGWVEGKLGERISAESGLLMRYLEQAFGIKRVD